jgi:hypothetical protein
LALTFFDCKKGKLGLFELMGVKEYAARILGRKRKAREIVEG